VNPVGVARRRQAQLSYWHKPDGGYIRRRKRELAAERREILRLLEEDAR
jgi:elongation factor P hydroxylase